MTPTEAAGIVDKQQSGPRAYSAASFSTGRGWLESRRVRFQSHRFRLVRKAERKQDEAETDGYLGIAR
jgi:hypothetical protein